MGVRSGVVDTLGTVDFWRGRCLYFRSRVVGCDHLAGRFEDNHQKSVFNPKQQKARDHYGSTEKYSEGKNTLVYSPLVQVDNIALCKHSCLSQFQGTVNNLLLKS